MSQSPFDGVPVFYINLDRDTSRRERLEAQFAQYGVKDFTRLPGVAAADLEVPEGAGLSAPELACSLAHLYAIKRYLETSSAPAALIFEDDVDLTLCESWGFTLQDFLARVPETWDCIQIVNSQPAQYPQWRQRNDQDWSTVGYIISRKFAEELIAEHFPDGIFAPYARKNLYPATAERVVYWTSRCFVVSLLSYHVYFQSNIHQNHVEAVHVPGRRRVMWWWKTLPTGNRLDAVFGPHTPIPDHPALRIEALEYHVTHGCNLTCQQCSHYSNFRLGGMQTVEQARQEYALWQDRVRPSLFALLGGEPTLNPELVEHLRLARECWPDSRLLLVSNGFFLERHPDLPKTLVDTNCWLDISQHGENPEYVEKLSGHLAILGEWQQAHPQLRLTLRRSHQGWMRQYRVVDGVPMPYNSEPADAFRVCMQRTCTQLHEGKLWKCPAIAYHGMFEKKLKLENVPEWQLFRDYVPLSPEDDDETIEKFFEQNEIEQCRLCPAAREPFVHPNPLLKESPLL